MALSVPTQTQGPLTLTLEDICFVAGSRACTGMSAYSGQGSYGQKQDVLLALNSMYLHSRPTIKHRLI